MSKAILTEEVINKWQPIIEAEGVAPIKDPSMKKMVIRLLENQVNEAGTVATDGSTNTDSAENFDPVLISLVRRTAPSLIANDLMGVQPMSGPTGLIFCMKAHSTDTSGTQVTDLYGPGSGAPDPTLTGKYATADAEVMGTEHEQGGAGAAGDPVVQSAPWAQMSYTIDKSSVTAESRALKAHYTTELAQDLKAIHGLDAETELANLLTGEVTAEINREVVNTLYTQAIPTLNRNAAFSHASAGGYDFFDYENVIAADGIYNLGADSGGRWEAEHYKNIIGMINRVCHEVALGTRRGLGNKVITNPAIAAAIDMVSKLEPNLDVAGGANMNNDNVGVTYAGRLLGRIDVYVDPYMVTSDVYVGFKGANTYDAGYFYCPYVPLTMMKAQGQDDFQPRIGFKTRYGMTHNPFTTGVADQNWYWRSFTVAGI